MNEYDTEKAEYLPFDNTERALHRLLIASYRTKELGLFYGKMGSAITFYYFGRITQNDKMESVADDLLDFVCHHVNASSSIGFARGMAGIGWGIEYLVGTGFVDGNAGEICEEIIHQVSSLCPVRMSTTLSDGSWGMLCYLTMHLFNCRKLGRRPSFPESFLQDCALLCEQGVNDDSLPLSYRKQMSAYLCSYHGTPFLSETLSLPSFVKIWESEQKKDVVAGLLSVESQQLIA